MRKLALLLLLVQLAACLPVYAAKPVTIQQLTRLLTSARGKPDAKIAQRLSGLELTERLSAERLSGLEAQLPGVESRRSLVLLADLSAFLPPPSTEIPATATPDLATQRQMIARVVEYAARTIHQLPNFIASRDTIRFEDSPREQTIFASVVPYKPLHAVQNYRNTAYYRDGVEVEDSNSSGGKKGASPTRGLITSGEFGPIINTVLLDAARGQMVWSHWEASKSGPFAVFRYEVRKEQSHYRVKFCCVAGEGESGVVERSTGYHGEIAVDPANGTIFRLTLRADLQPADKILRADILVQYGTIQIGGQSYVCPVKSISVSVAPLSSVTYLRNATRYAPSQLDQGSNGAYQTLLNDVVFDNYHIFRSEARVLTGESASKAEDSSPAAPKQSIPTKPPSEETPSETSVTREPSIAASDRRDLTPPQPAVGPEALSPNAVTPEISEGKVAGDPHAPFPPLLAPDRDFKLQVTTRLVDVGVVAFDRKGHPITGLKPEDFEIYDNGRKQEVRFFKSPANPEEITPQSQPVSSPGESVYSNRRAEIDSAKAGAGPAESSVTILMIDSDGLAWADLAYAREQTLRFLQTMTLNERIGVYILTEGGFQILVEATPDRPKLISALRQWMPTARDFAQAQDAEQRNRQQIDDVTHVEDLQYVNGNVPANPDSASSIDPQLRDFGSNLQDRALGFLVLVARHLAAIPGHKNLVWLASENVLANWTGQAVSSDKGSKHLENPVLRAQEALNDAHVSIYPFDMSRLETQAVDASLENHNVELSPSVTAPPGPQGGGAAPGRITAEMQQDVHGVQEAVREMAYATGGDVFRRGGDLVANLNSVLEDGRASYLLGFAPDVPADDQYHLLIVKLTSRRGARLRYRTGYLYSKEPVTLRDRFRQAVWEPLDVNEIAVTASPLPAFGGSAFKLNIAAIDLALQLKNGRWDDKLDIFSVQRTLDGRQAQISERQLVLSLLPATYQKLMETGVPFDQFIEKKSDTASIRLIVVDETSGRMGSVTVPADAPNGK